MNSDEQWRDLVTMTTNKVDILMYCIRKLSDHDDRLKSQVREQVRFNNE